MSHFKMNINQYIRVKLTPYGKEIYKQYYADYVHKMMPVDLDNYIDIQLYDFANIFGPACIVGADEFIEGCDIYIQADTLHTVNID